MLDNLWLFAITWLPTNIWTNDNWVEVTSNWFLIWRWEIWFSAGLFFSRTFAHIFMHGKQSFTHRRTHVHITHVLLHTNTHTDRQRGPTDASTLLSWHTLHSCSPLCGCELQNYCITIIVVKFPANRLLLLLPINFWNYLFEILVLFEITTFECEEFIYQKVFIFT